LVNSSDQKRITRLEFIQKSHFSFFLMQ
jgi:hypothetical protein